MYFRNATENDNIEFNMRLEKEGGIKDIYRKFLVICKNNVSYYQKEVFNISTTSGVYPKVFKIAQITSLHKKSYL